MTFHDTTRSRPAFPNSCVKPGQSEKAASAALPLSPGNPLAGTRTEPLKKALTSVQEHYMNKAASSAGAAGRRFAAVRADGAASNGEVGVQKNMFYRMVCLFRPAAPGNGGS